MTKTRMVCQNCGGDIGDVVCDDGRTFNKCRNCGNMQKRRTRKPSEAKQREREAAEKTLKSLLAAA